MNFILYVHDTSDTPVWTGEPQAAWRQVQRELNELIGDYTMGLVTVDVQPEAKALGERVAELEGMLSANTDDWFEAGSLVQRLVRNWNNDHPIAPMVNELRMMFDIDVDGSKA